MGGAEYQCGHPRLARQRDKTETRDLENPIGSLHLGLPLLPFTMMGSVGSSWNAETRSCDGCWQITKPRGYLDGFGIKGEKGKIRSLCLPRRISGRAAQHAPWCGTSEDCSMFGPRKKEKGSCLHHLSCLSHSWHLSRKKQNRWWTKPAVSRVSYSDWIYAISWNAIQLWMTHPLLIIREWAPWKEPDSWFNDTGQTWLINF